MECQSPNEFNNIGETDDIGHLLLWSLVRFSSRNRLFDVNLQDCTLSYSKMSKYSLGLSPLFMSFLSFSQPFLLQHFELIYYWCLICKYTLSQGEGDIFILRPKSVSLACFVLVYFIYCLLLYSSYRLIPLW
jgi:hypothetical protein